MGAKGLRSLADIRGSNLREQRELEGTYGAMQHAIAFTKTCSDFGATYGIIAPSQPEPFRQPFPNII